QSVLRKAAGLGLKWQSTGDEIVPGGKELELIKKITTFPEVVSESANNYSPAVIANYCYDLVKEYNQFYHDYPILKEIDEKQKLFRLQLTETTGKVIRNGMALLGIECPERM
nr:DALR anticodon-binding domain-containing protein [Prolixibacteraceae bacterium]